MGKYDHSKTAVWLLFVILSLPILSCGKKGPPVTPRELPPPIILDLAFELQAGEVTLVWTAPPAPQRVVGRYAGFFVYRSKASVTAPACPTCPILFERVAEVPYSGQVPGEEAITYTEAIEPGYHYTYKVTAYTEAGLAGDDSNRIDFTY